MSQSSGFTEPLYLGVSLGSENPLGKGSSRMRGPKHGGPTSSSSSSARDRARRSIRWRASFSPTPSRWPSRPPRVGCVTGDGVGYLSPRGGGGGRFPWCSTARGRPSASRSMVMRVRLRLPAGSLSFFWRAPLAVGERDVAACSRRGDGYQLGRRLRAVLQPRRSAAGSVLSCRGARRLPAH